jgi:NAD-dependent dihydropyrimidine dehydrogenase PreA subunit
MRYIDDVVTLTLDTDKCIGCKKCEMVCPHAVFAIQLGKATFQDRNACMECGACALNCPVEAITVQSQAGCAQAIIRGFLTGTEPNCDTDCCSTGKSSSKSNSCC